MNSHNRIPRNFNRINDSGSGYIAINLLAGKYACVFGAMLSNPQVFRITEIV